MTELEYTIQKLPVNLEQALKDIVDKANTFESDITLNLDKARYRFGDLFVGGQAIERNGKTMMAIRTLKFKEGSVIHLKAVGKDEKQAAQSYLAKLREYF